MLFAFRSRHQEQITLLTMLSLHLNTNRPDFVRLLDVNKHPRIVGFGGHFHETPLDRKFVIFETVLRPEIPRRFATAVNDAIRYPPRLADAGTVFHAECPPR